MGNDSDAATGTSGASLPYVEMEAHNAKTNGTILGPNYQLGNLASDAVDRMAVQLTSGQFVQFTLSQAANSINLRYSIPDASAGGGISAPLSIYINNVKQKNDLQLTSKYSWLYGAPNFSDCNSNVWSNTPGGTAHHQFDEIHALLPQMAAGTTVKLQVDSEDTAQWYVIDVADFQQVTAPIAQPAGSISITDAPYNADPTGAKDATTAIQNAVNDGAAQGKTVWIPQGTYLVTSHIVVDNVTLTGADPWYSILGGAPVGNGTGVGIYAKDTYDGKTSSNVHLSNFAIEGQITNRVDCIQDNGIGGSFNNSTISNIWIEHTKVGMWFDGPFSGLSITGCRIDSILADGINFHRAVSHSSVSQSEIRGTGDDSLAMWSDLNGASAGDSNNTFDHNTIQANYLANGIAIYGGTSNTVTNNLVQSSQYRGGGIMLDYEDFGSPTSPFSDVTTISNNTIQQVAGWGDQGIQQFGALMFWADNGSINAPFTVSNDEIDSSNFAAISFDGGNSISTLTMNGIHINGAEFAFSNKVSTVTGTATNVTAQNLSSGALESCESIQAWKISLDASNVGDMSNETCGFPTNTPTPPQPIASTSPTSTSASSTPTPTIAAQPTATPTPATGSTPTPTAQTSPAGSASYDAESPQNTRASNLKEFSCSLCSGGERIGWIWGADTLRFNGVTAQSTKTYTINIYYYNSIPNRATRLFVSANNGPAVEASLQVATVNCCDYAPYITSVSVTLQASTNNTITLSNPYGPAPDIDRIVIQP